ncbi:MAG: sigma-70 family RNA polymerase sigma factor [Planctomycetes bacterium]|nr:sigma-70 family RNA polymerase sigma factor [Planctomycetota bacterium]
MTTPNRDSGFSDSGSGEAPDREPDAAWNTTLQVERWQAGDPGAFELLHGRFAPLVRRRLQRHESWPIVARRMQIDDAAQEVWTRAIGASQCAFTPHGPGSFAAFLGAITDHTLVDLLRGASAQKRGGHAAIEALETGWERRAQPPPNGGALETPTGRARSNELLRIAAQELSERELEAWRMVEIEGYTTDEAGLALGCSGSAVRGLMLRSRQRLVMRLRRDYGDRG